MNEGISLWEERYIIPARRKTGRSDLVPGVGKAPVRPISEGIRWN